MVESIKSVAVIGAGTMGQGIAQVCSMSGYKVLLYDVQSNIALAGINGIKNNLKQAVEKNRITTAYSQDVINRIEGVDDFRQLQVDLVVEAVVEKLEVKQKIFIEIEKINGKDCILTSNTSSIPITQIATVLKHPHRFAGLHFFNPATVMKLIEIIKGASTDHGTITLLQSFGESISKVAVLVQDSPGFIVNRVARHYYVEALKLLEDGVTDVERIDMLMKASGFKMGPFELMDLIGIDINFSVTSSMYHAFHEDPKFRPSRIQQQKVDAGHYGRKTGKGFYDYAND